MGLEGISEYIRKKHPGVIREEHLSTFAFKKICVDISGFLYRYMSIHGKGDKKWLQSFINLILLMKNNYINFIPVFDGKPPKEKQEELRSRKESRNQIKDKVESLSTDLTSFHSDFEGIDEEEKQKITSRLLETLEKLKKNDEKESKTSLLRKFLQKEDTIEEKKEITSNDIKKISEYIEKQK
jgi:hypothetical protein